MRVNRTVVAMALFLVGSLGLSLVFDSPTGQFRGKRPARDVGMTMFGGLRQVVGSACWLRSYTAWEQREMEEALYFARMAVLADPTERFFWLNGARMIAYDFPRWELSLNEQAGVVLSQSQEMKIRETHVREALRWLDHASAALPDDPRIHVERGLIYLNLTGDRAQAAQCFRTAWETSEHPWFAARLYGELLRSMGRSGEALDWYRNLLPELPPDSPAAGADVVTRRIRELEGELEND